MSKITTTTAASKTKKPRPDFPLFAHQRGYWAKKVSGQIRYFDKVADDPKGTQNAFHGGAKFVAHIC